MIQRFVATTQFQLLNPSSAQTLIARSTDASDTMNLSIVGTTSAPAAVSETRPLTGQREVAFVTNTLAALTGINLASAATGTVKILQQGVKGWGDILVNAQPVDGDTLTVGLTGFTQVYTFRTVLALADEIAIGADKFVTAQNIGRALIAGTGSGTSYGVGTVANAFVTSWADSGFTTHDLNGTSETTIYIQDLIACARLLTWAVSTDCADIALRAPSSGQDGTILATLSPGTTQGYATINFWTPDLVATTLPAKATPTTDTVQVNGRRSTLHILSANLGSAVRARLETSDDGFNWASRVTDYPINNIDNDEFWYSLEPIEFLRVAFTVNANTVASAIQMALIVG